MERYESVTNCALIAGKSVMIASKTLQFCELRFLNLCQLLVISV